MIPDPTRPQLEVAARTFALLSAPVRLHWSRWPPRASTTWGRCRSGSGCRIATASQHLTKLRLAGIIHARRDGRRQIYTVDDPHVLTMVQQIFEHIAPDGTLAPDPPMPPR